MKAIRMVLLVVLTVAIVAFVVYSAVAGATRPRCGSWSAPGPHTHTDGRR